MHERRSHLPGLDGLRGLAAIGVVVLHVWLYTEASDPNKNHIVDAVIGELRVGLMAFFVMSAFLLVRPWIRAGEKGITGPSVRSYLVGRAARVLPAYWVALVVTLGLLHWIGSGRAADPSQVPLFAVLAQFQSDATRKLVLPQAWSLAVELWFYVLLPVIGWAIVRYTRRLGSRMAAAGVGVLLIVVGLLWCFLSEAGDWPVTVTASMPTFLPIFGCGILAAAIPPMNSTAVRWSLLGLGMVVVALNGLWHSQGTGLVGHVVRDLPAGAGFGLIVAALAAGPAGLLERTPLRWVGVVSYGLYLWHLPFLWVLRANDLLPEDPATAIVVVLLPSLVLGAISWYGIERPAMRWAQRRRIAERPPRGLSQPRRGEPSVNATRG